MRIMLFDTETTDLVGNSLLPLARQPKIIELFALIQDEEGKELGTFSQLFHPGFDISEEITRITGITNADLEGAPSFSEKAGEVVTLIEGCDLVVAHNLTFDRAMVNLEMARLGKEVRWPDVLCTVEASEFVKGHRLKLIDLHTYLFDEGFPNAHRAENDVRAMVRCFNEMRKRGMV